MDPFRIDAVSSQTNPKTPAGSILELIVFTLSFPEVGAETTYHRREWSAGVQCRTVLIFVRKAFGSINYILKMAFPHQRINGT